MLDELQTGQVLMVQSLITPNQLEEAMVYLAQHPEKTLMQVVVERGLCTQEAAQNAIARYNQYAVQRPHPDEAIAALEGVSQRINQTTQHLAVVAELIKTHWE